jgi:hypothetical protein
MATRRDPGVCRRKIRLNDNTRPSRGPLPSYHRREDDSRLLRSVPYAIGLVIIAAVGAGLYFFEGGAQRHATPEPSAAQPSPEPPRTASPSNADVQTPSQAPGNESEILHPLPAAAVPAGLEGKPLPTLPESDEAIRQALIVPLGKQAVGNIVISQDLARRIVATVDNLPRRKAGTKLLPLKAPAGSFVTGRKGTVATLSSANAARYAPYVKLAQAVDVKQLVSLYVYFYPLFQQAYEELGYPRQYFNDRLVAVIDDLLAAPEVSGPVKLIRPKVMYEFADPELEELSSGQKVLLRMGTENAAVIKAKLRDLRRELGVDGPAAKN